jgi:nitronate monooxygenase
MSRSDLSTHRLVIRGHSLLPVVQGGMGVGISAHRLAGHVAKVGAVGTIASIDLRHHHEDLVEKAAKSRDEEKLNKLNLIALDREIKTAKEIAEGNGLIAVNVMKAVSDHATMVIQACESGADAVVMGAGLPIDLPDIAADYPDTALIPILSEPRGVSIILKKWMKKGRLPDAIVIEHPKYAGGHLGSPKLEEVNDSKYDFSNVLPKIFNLFQELGLKKDDVPVIVAGGINSHEQVRTMITDLGASAVQLGTAFAVTQEGDAHPNFKEVLLNAKPEEDLATFISTSGFPARAVKTPWLSNYLKRESFLKTKAKTGRERCSTGLQCLTVCGLRDGLCKIGQFCIDSQLVAALKGDINRGLFFRGAAKLPFDHAIRSAKELVDYLLTGIMPDLSIELPAISFGK